MELTIPSLTCNLIGLSAILCFLVVIVVWAYMFGRVKFSQALLGAICCFALMLVENFLDSFALAEGSPLLRTGVLYALYIALTVPILRIAVQFGVFRGYLSKRFSTTDAAVGFAIGFACIELIVGGISNVSTYTLCVTCNNDGLASILAEAESATTAAELELALRTIAAGNSWQYLLSGVNRIFFLLQCISAAVLCWYAMERSDNRALLLAVAAQAIVRLPYGFYTAGLLTNFWVEELATYVLTVVFAWIASRFYNRLEGERTRFKGDRLQVRMVRRR